MYTEINKKKDSRGGRTSYFTLSEKKFTLVTSVHVWIKQLQAHKYVIVAGFYPP